MKTVLDVVDYLQERGYKCGKSAVYNHVRRGLLAKRKGEFITKDVEKYAGLYLTLESDGADPGGGDLDLIQREKLTADAEKARAQAEHWKLKTLVDSGRYIDRDLFFGEMASRATILKCDLENMIRSGAGAMVQTCEGDLVKVPDVIDFWLKKLEVTLGRYAEDKIWNVPAQVRIEGDGDYETE
jgi:hypothetical protein